jgi:hypothetical protein
LAWQGLFLPYSIGMTNTATTNGILIKKTIYQVIITGDDFFGDCPLVQAPLAAHIKKDFPEVKNFCYSFNYYRENVIKFENKKQMVTTTGTQNTFFDLFPFPFVYGKPANSLSDDSKIVLSEKIAEDLFGKINPVGKTIQLNKETLVVTGVYDFPGNSSIMPDVFYNYMDNDLKRNANDWGKSKLWFIVEYSQ